MLTIGKITAKGQTTIPQEIRALLNVKPGDRIVWEANNGSVQVRRAEPLDMDYLHALEGTLSEWASAADEVAYRDL
ncbi:AbrB/MazE/SpoVT family DNA-binding domain-containing protein [Chromatium okenii]|jgi:AbrB family looped-hinge helix DNA binding protein|uniref:AbrB family transcriptional regulator n=1 Tax=Chromatium okenii TaxID=61644 RepID=A0A2S7XPG2_9GAMM|nr:AbrB/MazE/SpoVT family DNA-binding domain-containing protein [Chromatium okenii]MBV5309579.1 AbrB/MazE/SpoVT family DNA-binding domain-containing protein [Chromatium okenii]PQJ95443.1 AbrB family transcriptional regulator [Chromatium okenii]